MSAALTPQQIQFAAARKSSRVCGGEFKEFIQRGNVLELGVGIVIGGAFTAVLNSFVNDILTPPLGLVISGSNLENFFLVIRVGKNPTYPAIPYYDTLADAQADGAITENVGNFIKTVINFLMVAVALFMIIFIANRVKSFRAEHRLKHHEGLTEEQEEAAATQGIPAKPVELAANGTTISCQWCSANVPVKAVKCMFCASYLSEKVPEELLNKKPQAALIELDG